MTKSLGKGRGRPRGSRNKRTIALEQASVGVSKRLKIEIPEAFSGDALDLLRSIYIDPAMPVELRLDAASRALPYERPRLQAVEFSIPSRGETTIRHELSDASIKKIFALAK